MHINIDATEHVYISFNRLIASSHESRLDRIPTANHCQIPRNRITNQCPSPRSYNAISNAIFCSDLNISETNISNGCNTYHTTSLRRCMWFSGCSYYTIHRERCHPVEMESGTRWILLLLVNVNNPTKSKSNCSLFVFGFHISPFAHYIYVHRVDLPCGRSATALILITHILVCRSLPLGWPFASWNCRFIFSHWKSTLIFAYTMFMMSGGVLVPAEPKIAATQIIYLSWSSRGKIIIYENELVWLLMGFCCSDFMQFAAHNFLCSVISVGPSSRRKPTKMPKRQQSRRAKIFLQQLPGSFEPMTLLRFKICIIRLFTIGCWLLRQNTNANCIKSDMGANCWAFRLFIKHKTIKHILFYQNWIVIAEGGGETECEARRFFLLFAQHPFLLPGAIDCVQFAIEVLWHQ